MEQREREKVEEERRGGVEKPTGQQITVHGLRIPLPFTFSLRYPSPGRRGWPVKLIIIKSHSVCRGRPPFVRPRVLLTLI